MQTLTTLKLLNPVSTKIGDHFMAITVLVFKPVTQANSAWPSLHG